MRTLTRSRTARGAAALLTALALSVGGTVGAATAAPPPSGTDAAVHDPLDHVDPMVGTGAATGAVVGEINNFPGPSMPFGMVQVSPDTPSSYAGYRHSDSEISGFSLTHAAAGCNVFGDLPLLPVTGDIGEAPWDRTEQFSHDAESAEVGKYAVTLENSDIDVELFAATRSAGMTFDFPEAEPAQVILDAGGSKASVYDVDLQVDGSTVTGAVTTGGFCGKDNQHTTHFVMEFDTAVEDFGTWQDGELRPGEATASGQAAGAWLTFPAGSEVTVKSSISYVDAAGAAANLAEEIPEWDVDSLQQANRDAWAEMLGRIEVSGGADTDTTMFYTSLYHSLMHPNTFNDVDGRYAGFDGEIHEVDPGHTQYANFSDWDTYRSLAALHAIIAPERASDMAQSLVNDAEQFGWLPRWPVANQPTGQMTGDSSVPLIASLHAFGARDFDVDAALDHMIKGATQTPADTDGYVQRPGLESYLELGYGPQTEDFRGDHRIVGASVTLEWSIADFAIGQLATATGRDEVAAEFQARGQYWQNIYDPATDLMSARSESGEFIEPSGGSGFGQEGFDEGNDHQYTWLVPQNVAGLVEALGGREAASTRLDEFTSEHNAGDGSPKLWIGNEPNFGVPWLYNYVGQPARTSELVDDIIDELFQPTPNGKPGNDDLGAQAGWYVWAAMGLYPSTPGTDVLTLNAPRFERVAIDLGEDRQLEILAPGAAGGSRYIAGMEIDGEPWERTFLPEDLIAEGGVIDMSMSDSPDQGWGTGEEAAPPSFREGESQLIATATPSFRTVAPGESATVTTTVQAFGGNHRPVAVDVDAPEGISATARPLRPDSSGQVVADIDLTVSDEVAVGDHDVELTVGRKGSDEVRTLPIRLRVAPPGSLTAAFDTVGSAPDDGSSPGDLDGSGNSLSQEALADAGLVPGSEHEVHGLAFSWPDVAPGSPNALTADGQRVELPGAAESISFVGVGTHGNVDDTVSVELTDGTTQEVPIALGDWVLPTEDGSPIDGNTVVATMDHNSGGASTTYLFATDAWSPPEGTQIAAVTFPSNENLHVFAIADDGAQVAEMA